MPGDTYTPRSAAMAPAAYRAVTLTVDGHVVSTQRLDALDDDEATTLAKAMANGHAIELWDGLRFIEHFEADLTLS